MGKRKIVRSALEGTLATALAVETIGFALGMESNIRPFDKTKITDTSFSSYLEQAKEQCGNDLLAYSLAIWTYPGMRAGVAIHNYGLTENSP